MNLMKKLLFFFTFLSFLFSLNAQTFKLNETTYSYWSESYWIYSSKLSFSYDTEGKATRLLFQTWSEGSWQDYMRYDYYYDPENRISLMNILEFSGGSWSEYMKIEYIYEAGSSDYISITYMLNGAVWENYSKTVYFTDELNNITHSVTSMWTDGDWSEYSRTEYRYTTEGNTDEYLMYVREDDSWKNYYWFDYFYDSENLNYLNYKYIWNTDWQLSSKDDNSFDGNGNMVLSVTQAYSDGNWSNQSKAEHSYIEFTGLNDTTIPLPEDIELYQNYPNPFNPETEISFYLKNDSQITLELFNSSGQLVQVLSEGKRSAGRHKIFLKASDFDSGIYFYTLRTGSNAVTKKMTIIK